MNILLIFPGFIIAFIIVLYYERKIRNLSKNHNNNVHFYVARDKNGKLWLYMGKPVRYYDAFIADLSKGNSLTDINFRCFGLDEKDYVNLKWEDEPVEVFINMED